LGGSFVVECYDGDNRTLGESDPIHYSTNPYWTAIKISERCNGLYEKLEGLWCDLDDKPYDYR
jgi:hypothetical protein